MALFDPGPFTHVGIAVGSSDIADSYPQDTLRIYRSGPDIRSLRDHLTNRKFVIIRTDISKLGAIAYKLTIDLNKAGYNFGGLFGLFVNEGPKPIFCSQFTARAYAKAGLGSFWGIGPNTQYYQWRMRGY